MRTFNSKSVTQTHNFAQKIASQLKPGWTVALYGQLGSGKTSFTQGFAKALGIDKTITSPTYTIINQYPIPQNRGELIHIDLYRLQSPKDAKSFDLDEILQSTSNTTIIEWPEKIEKLLPQQTLKIHFKIIDQTTRKITLNHPT